VNFSNSGSHSLLCCIVPRCRVCVFMIPYVGYVTGQLMVGICILLQCLERFYIINFILLNVWINLSPRLIILFTEFYRNLDHIFMCVGKWQKHFVNVCLMNRNLCDMMEFLQYSVILKLNYAYEDLVHILCSLHNCDKFRSFCA